MSTDAKEQTGGQDQGGSTGYVEWGQKAGKPSSNGEKGKFLERVTLEENVPKRLRLVGKAYKFWRHYDPIIAITKDFAQDVCWQAGNRPKERYAILCFDRSDENKFKVFEFSPVLYNAFNSYFELAGADPGGAEGPDWMVKKEIPVRMKDGRPVKDKRNTKYTAMPVAVTKFTEKEAAFSKENWVELPEVFKPRSAELITEMFEDAKKLHDGDPIPGSNDWWKARKENKAGGNSDSSSNASNTTQAPDAREAKAPLVPAADDADIGVGDGFASLFPEDGDGEKTKF